VEIFLFIEIKNLNDSEFTDYVLNLLARWIFGISDLADRNFLRKDGHVYSIDEEYKDRSVSFKTELRKNKCDIIIKWLNKNYNSKILPFVSKWSVPEKYKNKLKELQNKQSVIGLFIEDKKIEFINKPQDEFSTEMNVVFKKTRENMGEK